MPHGALLHFPTLSDITCAIGKKWGRDSVEGGLAYPLLLPCPFVECDVLSRDSHTGSLIYKARVVPNFDHAPECLARNSR